METILFFTNSHHKCIHFDSYHKPVINIFVREGMNCTKFSSVNVCTTKTSRSSCYCLFWHTHWRIIATKLINCLLFLLLNVIRHMHAFLLNTAQNHCWVLHEKRWHIEGQTVVSRVNRHTHWAHKLEYHLKTFTKAQQMKGTKQNTHCTKQCQVHNRLDRFSSVGSWSITLHHVSLQNGEANKLKCFQQHGISSNSTQMLI